MFNDVSRRYDFLNHFLSAGIDRYWRRQAIKISRLSTGELFLDVASGTGDLAIEAAKKNPARIVAVDFAEKMLRIFIEKMKGTPIEGKVDPIHANAERLPFGDDTFDTAAAAFGVRNFGDLRAGLREMHRVTKKGGRVVILEFSKPKIFPVRQIYFFYFERILPLIGRLISGDRAAYSYLPNSVASFPDGKSFESILREVDFRNVRSIPLTFGIATAYFGTK
jgi:demethylmenaquinone methyltransferase / 2-methoxy-6-polyprenyl-1,4-benzoquinol methylase